MTKKTAVSRLKLLLENESLDYITNGNKSTFKNVRALIIAISAVKHLKGRV